MMLRQMGMSGPIGPPPSLTGSQPQIGPGPGSTPMINNPMMHGTPGGMHVRVLLSLSKHFLIVGLFYSVGDVSTYEPSEFSSW